MKIFDCFFEQERKRLRDFQTAVCEAIHIWIRARAIEK